MAIHLRNALVSKSKDAQANVYNWQFVNCLKVWAQVRSEMQRVLCLFSLIKYVVQRHVTPCDVFVVRYLAYVFGLFFSKSHVSDTLATLQRPRGLEGTPDFGPSVPTIIAFREVTALELPAYRLADRCGLSSHQRWT
jgi:hypothetical protein